MGLGLKQITASHVHALKVTELGLDAEALDLTAIEAISASLRRSARIHCPCALSTLVDSVVRPLVGLANDLTNLHAITSDTLQMMTAYGDFIEEREVTTDSQLNRMILLYQTPLSFVYRRNGSALILGTAADPTEVLPAKVYKHIEYSNHVRRLPPIEGEELRTLLSEFGLIELSDRNWLRSPQSVTAEAHLQQVDTLLDRSQPSGEVAGLRILDSSLPKSYYPNRWVSASSQTGRFVGRRARSYGSDIWCYLELLDGVAKRLLDFPLVESRWRGCDEAWRLQLAIDATRNESQTFHIVEGPMDTVILEFNSPIPLWAQRRLDVVGEPLTRRNSLFRYRVPMRESDEEVHFLVNELWLSPKTNAN